MTEAIPTSDDEIFEMAELSALLATRGEEWIGIYNFFMAQVKALENNGWKRREGMTQHDKILQHIKKAGSITNREAMIEYSIASLTKRISELRDLGYDIVSNVKHHPVTKQKYVRYTLA